MSIDPETVGGFLLYRVVCLAKPSLAAFYPPLAPVHEAVGALPLLVPKASGTLHVSW